MSLASLEWSRAATGGRKRGFGGFVVDMPLLLIVLAIVVENAPGGGSAFAAPIARRILDVYLLTPEQLAEQDAKRKPAPPAPVPRPGETE